MAAIFTIYLAYLNALLRISDRAISCHISSRGSIYNAHASPCIIILSMPELIRCHTHKETACTNPNRKYNQ